MVTCLSPWESNTPVQSQEYRIRVKYQKFEIGYFSKKQRCVTSPEDLFTLTGNFVCFLPRNARIMIMMTAVTQNQNADKGDGGKVDDDVD